MSVRLGFGLANYPFDGPRSYFRWAEYLSIKQRFNRLDHLFSPWRGSCWKFKGVLLFLLVTRNRQLTTRYNAFLHDFRFSYIQQAWLFVWRSALVDVVETWLY